MLIALAFLGIFLYVYVREYGLKLAVVSGICLVLVGTGLNMSEWLVSGCVKDYINFFWLFMFNFNDLLVTMGFVILGSLVWKKH